MRYGRGDELLLKVEDLFGYSDKTYRSVKVQVIGHNTDCDGPDAEYLVYVPPYERIGTTFILTPSHAKWFKIDAKFIGEQVTFIVARHPIYKHYPAPQGERCTRCKEFFEGVTKDQNGSYRCRACTLDPWR